MGHRRPAGVRGWLLPDPPDAGGAWGSLCISGGGSGLAVAALHVAQGHQRLALGRRDLGLLGLAHAAALGQRPLSLCVAVHLGRDRGLLVHAVARLARVALEGLLEQLGGYYPILLACMVIVLAAGTILESLPNTIIFAPILAPIAQAAGVNPIHFAVVFLVGDAIGFITPPYGLNLYVASGITGIPYFRLLRYTMPYLIALLITWAIIAMVPQLSTALLVNQGAGVYQLKVGG